MCSSDLWGATVFAAAFITLVLICMDQLLMVRPESAPVWTCGAALIRQDPVAWFVFLFTGMFMSLFLFVLYCVTTLGLFEPAHIHA